MNMMKKVLALVCALAMVLCLLSGCAAKQTPADTSKDTPSDNAGETAPEAKADPEKKLSIGVVIWSTDDGLGADSKKALDAAASALGVDLIYRTGSFDAESQTTDFENLIAAGVDGILVVPLVDTATDELLKVCEDADIPMQIMYRNIIDQDTYDYCMASKNFSGYVVESEEGAAADMVDKLVSVGCKAIGLLNRESGNGVVDRRQNGVRAYLDQKGITYYETTLSSTATAADMGDSTAQLLAAHPDIDGLILSSGANGCIDGLITYLEGMDVKLTSFDTPVDLATSLDAGNLVMLTTGAQIDPVFAMLCLYNKMQGTPYTDKPVEINSNYIYLQSAEDVTTYDEYFGTFRTYSADEIVELSKMDYDAFLKEVADYSMESVVARNS